MLYHSLFIHLLNVNIQNVQNVCLLPENGIIIIVFVYDFNGDNTLEAVQEQSNYVLFFFCDFFQKAKTCISTGLFFLVYRFSTDSSILSQF